MSVVIWLDVLLIVLGLLAVSPRLWVGFRRRRMGCPPPMGRATRTAAALLFYLGTGFLTAVGVDIGLAEWDKAHRPESDDGDAALAEFLEAHRLRSPINPEAYPKPEAPDFRLPVLYEDRSIRLKDFRGRKPVVLLFGSFG
jgi:hypothetical protein